MLKILSYIIVFHSAQQARAWLKVHVKENLLPKVVERNHLNPFCPAKLIVDGNSLLLELPNLLQKRLWNAFEISVRNRLAIVVLESL